jgi:hypothetical protein
MENVTLLRKTVFTNTLVFFSQVVLTGQLTALFRAAQLIDSAACKKYY